jgi:predicted transcriptional regulator
MARLIKRLMDRGLVERESVPQRSGKGIMYALRVKDTPELRDIKTRLGLI